MFLKAYYFIIDFFKNLSIPIYRLKIEQSKLETLYFPQYKKYGRWDFFYEEKSLGYSSHKYNEKVSFKSEDQANKYIRSQEKKRQDQIQMKLDSKKRTIHKRVYLNRQDKIKDLI